MTGAMRTTAGCRSCDPSRKRLGTNAVLVSRTTARELGVQNGDVVEITLNVSTAQRPHLDAAGHGGLFARLALGYGRERAGRVGTGVRVPMPTKFSTANTLRPARRFARRARPRAGNDAKSLVMEGRPIVREANLAEFSKDPGFANQCIATEPPVVQSLYPNPLDEVKKTALHQWGMAID